MSNHRTNRLSPGRRALRETLTEGEKSRGVAWVRAFLRWLRPSIRTAVATTDYGVHVTFYGRHSYSDIYLWPSLRHRSFNFVREVNRG